MTTIIAEGNCSKLYQSLVAQKGSSSGPNGAGAMVPVPRLIREKTFSLVDTNPFHVLEVSSDEDSVILSEDEAPVEDYSDPWASNLRVRRAQINRAVDRLFQLIESNREWGRDNSAHEEKRIVVRSPQAEAIGELVMKEGDCPFETYDRVLKVVPSVTALQVGQKIFRAGADGFQHWLQAACDHGSVSLICSLLGGTKGLFIGPLQKATKVKKSKKPRMKTTMVVKSALAPGKSRRRRSVVVNQIKRPLQLLPTDRYIMGVHNPFNPSTNGLLGPGCVPSSVPRKYHVRGLITAFAANTSDTVVFFPHPNLFAYGNTSQCYPSSASAIAYTSNPYFKYLESWDSTSLALNTMKVEACGIRFRSCLASTVAPATIDMCVYPVSNELVVSANALESLALSNQPSYAADLSNTQVTTNNILLSPGAINMTTSDIYSSALEVALKPISANAFQADSYRSSSSTHVFGGNTAFDQGFSEFTTIGGASTTSFSGALFRPGGWECLQIGFNNTPAGTIVLEFEYVLHASGTPYVASTAGSTTINSAPSGSNTVPYVSADAVLSTTQASTGTFKVLKNGFNTANKILSKADSTATMVSNLMNQSNLRMGSAGYSNKGGNIGSSPWW